MFRTVISAAIVLTNIGAVLAAPQATSTASLLSFCRGTYGPFQLFAKVGNNGPSYPIRLLVDEVTAKNATSYMIIDKDEASAW